MSEFGDNIRVISREAHLQRQINELQERLAKTEKASIKGGRSIGYVTRNGGNGTASGGKGVDTIFADTVGNEIAATGTEIGTEIVSGTDFNIGEGGSGGEDGTGTSGADGVPNTLDDFTQDLNDLATNAPAVGSIIKGLEGMQDCTTAEEAYIGIDGFYLPEIIEGLSGGFNGETTTDPRDFGFSAGTTWVAAAGVGSTPYAAALDYILILRATVFPLATMISVGANPPGSDYLMTFNPGDGSIDGETNVTGSGCTIGVDANCPATNPNAGGYVWTSDSVHQLAFDGAQFKTSDNEHLDDQNPAWVNSPSSVSGCTSGAETVTVAADGAQGSTVTFGNGNSFTMDSTGTVTSINYP